MLHAYTNGQGPLLLGDHDGPAGDLLVLRSEGLPRFHIDHLGRGFFSGGIQSAGADVAEIFEVEGEAKMYEPGDVLEISTTEDRHVLRSVRSYSTRIIGVYALRPGVVLSEEPFGNRQGDAVPVGVIGVPLTKVTAENGPQIVDYTKA